jgi:hypothetical protein
MLSGALLESSSARDLEVRFRMAMRRSWGSVRGARMRSC